MKKIKSVNNQAIILLSGGIDSAVSAYFHHENGVNLHALTFTINDGFATGKSSIRCAREIASKLNLKHIIIDLSCLLPLVNDALNCDNIINKIQRRDRAIPFGVELILLSSKMYAVTHKIKRIIWSINRDDIGDQMPLQNIAEYVNIFDRLTRFRRGGDDCKIETPMITMRKTEIIYLGEKLGVPFENTFSCLFARDEMVHCGKCEQCIQRIYAFENLKKGGSCYGRMV